MEDYERIKNEIPIKLEIIIIDGHWFINGKTYAECGFVEKYYFDLYLRYKRKLENAKKLQKILSQ